MKFLVTGAAGQLGHDVMNELYRRGHEGIGTDLAEAYSGIQDGSPVTRMPYISLDITDETRVREVVEEIRPDAIVHCAAWTAVDAAERPENSFKVRNINGNATAYIAAAAKAVDAKLLYLSTDYVFDGEGTTPWEPDCKNFRPLNVYGRSKLAGEIAVSSTLEKFFIVRIAWVFGLNGKNFINTMLRLSETHDTIRVVKDQIGTPTYTFDLARLLVDMLETEKYGYYHATNDGGFVSWYDIACEIFRQAGINVNVIPVTTEEYGLSEAARPFNSRLSKRKLIENGFTLLPPWQDAISRYLQEMKR